MNSDKTKKCERLNMILFSVGKLNLELDGDFPLFNSYLFVS